MGGSQEELWRWSGRTSVVVDEREEVYNGWEELWWWSTNGRKSGRTPTVVDKQTEVRWWSTNVRKSDGGREEFRRWSTNMTKSGRTSAVVNERAEVRRWSMTRELPKISPFIPLLSIIRRMGAIYRFYKSGMTCKYGEDQGQELKIGVNGTHFLANKDVSESASNWFPCFIHSAKAIRLLLKHANYYIFPDPLSGKNVDIDILIDTAFWLKFPFRLKIILWFH
ncbi:hypothetical protein IEQ34_019542 [Dendrobium chrysotoxum]|uniref:Uncharacterized protein n=1 Tax=Dendrobium chrysotoxum TaxID=161865 RepID=A0AAV7G8T5_DENCH|nr:hypothetical protein IEQ34_019542 [Dendrobium chrysotoxum]